MKIRNSHSLFHLTVLAACFGVSSASGQLVQLRPVVSQSGSGPDLGIPPLSDSVIAANSAFVVELWAQQRDPSVSVLPGLACVYADLVFDGTAMVCDGAAVESSYLGVPPSWACGVDSVTDLGGCTFSLGLGVIPEWVRVGTLHLTAMGSGGGYQIHSGPAALDCSIIAFGVVPTAQIDFASSPLFSIGCVSAADCDDGNPCTIDSCDAGIACVHDGTGVVDLCDDGLDCTVGDSCLGDVGGTCAGSADMFATPCDDGDACTTDDACVPGAGVCGGGTAIVCDDLNLCTDDTCDPVVGCAFTNNTAPCDDGNFCTINDVCQGGACTPGFDACTPTTSGPEVDHVSWTHSDTENTRDFLWTPSVLPLGGSFDVGLSSVEFYSEASTRGDQGAVRAWILNDASTAYGVVEAFVPEQGAVVPAYRCAGQAPDTCALTLADGFGGSSFVVRLATREKITVTISRVRYVWDYTPPVGGGCTQDADCDDADACNGQEACDLASGLCQDGMGVLCDDSNVCNGLESCDPGSGLCLGGTPLVCDDGLYCNGRENCGPAVGCVGGVAPCPGACDELSDLCAGCLDDAACDDGVFCNGQETCVGGACQLGAPVSCWDGIPCTDDSCNEALGVCDHVANDVLCSDGLFCSGIEICDLALGGCVSETPVQCDDGVPCTVDTCNDLIGACEYLPDDTVCDDFLVCNGAATCDATVGCVAGPAPDCTALDDACNVGACVEGAGGCVATPVADGTGCDNGDACAGDACVGGVCDPVTPCGPAPPSNLTAQFRETAKLSWTPSSDANLDGYNVYRSNVAGGPHALLTVLDFEERKYDDESVAPGFYCYVVTAFDTAGDESVATNEVCGTTSRN